MPLEPINYMINQPNQGNNFMEGLQIGQALKQIGAQRAAEEQAAQAKEQYAIDLKSAFDNPTPESFAMLSTKYPTQREAFKQSFEMLEAPRKEAEKQITGQVYIALLNNKPEIANGIINEQILALENSGKDASKLKKIKETIEQDPQTATGIAGLMLSNMMGQKEFKDYQDALGIAGKETREKTLFPETQAQAAAATQKAGYETAIKEAEAIEAPAQQKAKTKEQIAKATTEEWNAKYAPAIKESGLRLNQAQISNIGSQIADRSARLRLDTSKINLDIAEKLQKLSNKALSLPATALNMVNDASTKSAIAGQSATQLNGLATKMDKIKSWSGYAGGSAEFFKKALGYQDAITGVKKEYIRLKNDAVIKSLPPGPSTDRDIQLFSAGFPDENSDPKELASFLRGMAKIQKISAKVEEAKADWVTETGGSLGRTRTGFTAGGYQVKPNQSFGEFSQAVAKAVTIKEAKKEQTSPKNLNVPAPFIPTKQSQKLFDSADAIIYGGR